MELTDLYSDRILEIAGNQPRPGRLAAPDASARRVSRICGSTIEVDGHGFGHGRGMSQYGSEGAARKGLNSTQIMEFYYPGTTAGQARGRVKVWISGDNDNRLTVVRRPGLTVKSLATKKKIVLPGKRATKWRLSPGAGTRTVVPT